MCLSHVQHGMRRHYLPRCVLYVSCAVHGFTYESLNSRWKSTGEGHKKNVLLYVCMCRRPLFKPSIIFLKIIFNSSPHTVELSGLEMLSLKLYSQIHVGHSHNATFLCEFTPTAVE